MAVSCHDMKKGQIYSCPECGLELQVVAECKECGTPTAECGCNEPCTFQCCGTALVLKE